MDSFASLLQLHPSCPNYQTRSRQELYERAISDCSLPARFDALRYTQEALHGFQAATFLSGEVGAEASGPVLVPVRLRF